MINFRSTGARILDRNPQRHNAPVLVLSWGLLFALAYGQSALFTSNQHQYFLHGLAQAGVGFLRQDWLANTIDPTPVFSALVYSTQSWLHSGVFYLYYGVLLGAYLIGLRMVLGERFDLTSSRLRRIGSLFALTALHAAALRFLLGQTVGHPFLLEGGFAGQRLLGPVLQPSSFGALLVVSLALYLDDRPYAAAALAALAATFHPTYLLTAGALVVSYMWVLVDRQGQFKRGFGIGALALTLVLPVMVYSLTVFRPTSAQLWNQASEILVEFRLPHHALPRTWFSAASLIKVGLIALGLHLARRTRLAPVMTIMAGVGGVLSAAQILSGSNRLALLFPWRVSTLLVPLASGLVLMWALGPLVRWLESHAHDRRRRVVWIFWVGGALLAAAGLLRTVQLERQQHADPAQPMYRFVREQREASQVFLIPPKLQPFRLETGAPAFVDFKSIPYRDAEVIEWHERVRLARFFYRDDPQLIDCGVLESIRGREQVTHVVLEAEQFGLQCPGFSEVFRDPNFAVYELVP
ncbi:MAG: DUF6798 domain-containing protein [Anaerolineales bacterium]|nr:DUF6798 domain-containing protein [Anaerolineales bacterium]